MRPWEDGDIVSICCAVLYLPLGLYLQPTFRTARGWMELLATGNALGTLLLITFDPFRQMVGLHRSLLAIALEEGRATLWWSAAVAVIYLMKSLFEPAEPAAS